MSPLFRAATLVVLALAIGHVVAQRSSSARPQNAPKPHPQKQEKLEKMQEIGLSNQKFTTKLYKVLAREEGNLFFSPLSIHSILTLASLGAEGDTKTQLRTGLSLPTEPKTNTGYRVVNKELNKYRANGTLTVANKVYINKGAKINSDFQQKAQQVFQTQLEGIDFKNTGNAARTINAWVEAQTNKRIKDIVDPGSLGNSAMVLVNAVYFKAQWESVFSSEGTFNKEFKIKPNQEVSIPMMYSKTVFKYQKISRLKCQLVELDYVGDQMNMIVILPDDDFGLPELEKRLAAEGLETVTGSDKFHMGLTTIILPKFKFDKSTVLTGALRELGMTDMFGGTANFRGMTTGDARVRISEIAHKAFIEVNEEGTEAAGASFGGEPLSVPPPQEYFVADHPFIFLIQHKESRNILFIGRFAAPPPPETEEHRPDH